MCGINGFNFRDEDLLSRMNFVTKHRGPDGCGHYYAADVSLGHNRLSIIDLSEASSQPMFSSDQKLVIVFNGEIYNFQELRSKLSDYRFKTCGDTEVILAAYRRWGRDCVKHLNGIFAFAIYDLSKQELFLARDPLGIKPLYYYYSAGKFYFSSEIKALLEVGMERRIDREALSLYLRLLYVPEPRTMFAGIKKLPPASWAVIKDGQLEIKTYWQPQIVPNHRVKSLRAEAKDLRKEIEAAVSRQLVSDRPLGLYLSGGIDSTVILDCVSRLRKNIDTFSIGFELEEKAEEIKFNHDFNLAKETAKYYQTNHHQVLLSATEVIRDFEKVTWHLDEPISNPTIFALYKLSAFAKASGIDVVLGGDGGDELFGGYHRYQLSCLSDCYQKVPKFIRRFLARLWTKTSRLNLFLAPERAFQFMVQKDQALAKIIKSEYFSLDETRQFFARVNSTEAKNFNQTAALMLIDRRSWLTDFALMISDKMTMASAIEERVPLLDLQLVNLTDKIPVNYKVSVWQTKKILRKAFAGNLPQFILRQTKRGFFSPGAKWLREEKFKYFVADVLNQDYYPETEKIFNWPELTKILAEHQNQKSYHFNSLWAILTLQVWAKIYQVKF